MSASSPTPSPFDHGVRLFNARAFFEAHEAWEDVWREEVDPEKRWLQGLIQIAAAFVHFERGFHAHGFSKLLAEGRRKLTGPRGVPFPLDLERALADLEPWFEHGRRVAAGADLLENAPPDLPRLDFEAGYEPDALARS